ncbi:hypothetical protein F511_36730 [Dorcoceras hygrometricum]|uniref:Uncharacterized protein n=1 Tax=Dorcoceras hygrometricum TaxID=472368 RepID=A0A2Z7BMV4_9LAMI|nr:hypothetical protein F511_36730 [Dorcoceras hygrometricum]
MKSGGVRDLPGRENVGESCVACERWFSDFSSGSDSVQISLVDCCVVVLICASEGICCVLMLENSDISAFVLDDFGGAEFHLSSSFDYYPFDTLNQRWKGTAKLLEVRRFLRNLLRSFFSSFELLNFSSLKPSAVNFEPGEICFSGREFCRALCVVPEKSNAIIGVVTVGFKCLPPSCDWLTGPDDHGPMISTCRLAVRGIEARLS